MDPDANLKEQLALVLRFLDDYDEGRNPDSSDIFRLAELVEGLDEWFRKGGFLPKRWSR